MKKSGPAKNNSVPVVVYLLSAVSFFNDIASEMLYPVMPIFITQILGAPVFVVGIIDGIAEGASAFFKSVFGRLSDRLQRRKIFVVSGYSASAFSKIIIAVSSTWPMVFLGRFTDRLGKGIRTGARDAMLLETTDRSNKGLIFGIHRSIDSAGAVVGPLITLILLKSFSENIRTILMIAAIPSFIGLLFFFFIKEAKKNVKTAKKSFSFDFSSIPNNFKVFLVVTALFSLGNSSDSFLILQSKSLGLSVSSVVLVYIVYNLVYTLLSTPAGILADRLGAKNVFPAGLFIYGIVYLGFAFNRNVQYIWILFAAYGAYIAFTDGVSKALIGNIIKKEEAGTAYGLSQTVTSVGTLFASVIAGFIWSALGAKTTFIFASACTFLSLIVYIFFLKKDVFHQG
ncbi:MFS transporter [Candidatus Roizmanbacteria bacterium]|nr:MFS transporter [Candidatus Roizmanbacteria bacterium]